MTKCRSLPLRITARGTSGVVQVLTGVASSYCVPALDLLKSVHYFLGTKNEVQVFSLNSSIEDNSATTTATATGTATAKVSNKRVKEKLFPNMETKHADRLNSLYRIVGLNLSNNSLCSGKAMLTSNIGFSNLSLSAVNSVEKFVFFVGYARSGHSMVGSVIDAHPDMVIAHEYFLFDKCIDMLKQGKDMFEDKVKLFDSLYANSLFTARCGWRSDTNTAKGYNFKMNLHWQGTFNRLRVIGDKSGDSAAEWIATVFGQSCLQNMMKLKVPLVAIHVVRNPYDMIATSVLYGVHGLIDKATLGSRKAVSENQLLHSARRIFGLASAISNFSSEHNITVVEVHIEDYIRSPRSVIEELCHSLGVDCSQHYVEECARKAYSSVSRSRDHISWPPNVRYFVEQQIKKFPFFKGYSLKNDFRRHT